MRSSAAERCSSGRCARRCSTRRPTLPRSPNSKGKRRRTASQRFAQSRRTPCGSSTRTRSCLSAFSTYFRQRPDFPTDREDLVFYYRQYLRLMAHWRATLPPERFVEVDYEALVGILSGWQPHNACGRRTIGARRGAPADGRRVSQFMAPRSDGGGATNRGSGRFASSKPNPEQRQSPDAPLRILSWLQKKGPPGGRPFHLELPPAPGDQAVRDSLAAFLDR